MKTANPGGRPWLKILGIFVVIIIILYFFDLRLIIRQIRTANFAYLGAALAVLALSYLVMAVRLRHMLGNQPKLGYTFHTINIANMMNLVTFIPVTWIKIYMMGQNKKVGIPRATSSITVGIAISVDLLPEFESRDRATRLSGCPPGRGRVPPTGSSGLA